MQKTVSSSVTELLPRNSRRRGVIIANTGTVPVYLSLDGETVPAVGEGIPLQPGEKVAVTTEQLDGSTYANFAKGPIAAAAESAAVVDVQEFYGEDGAK